MCDSRHNLKRLTFRKLKTRSCVNPTADSGCGHQPFSPETLVFPAASFHTAEYSRAHTEQSQRRTFYTLYGYMNDQWRSL